VTEMTESAELVIDDEAMRRADLAFGEAIGKQGPATDAAVAAASPRIVAAELRRIADEPGMGFMTGPHDVSAATRLRARADELDPPARQEN
jgi:hypothetical protein